MNCYLPYFTNRKGFVTNILKFRWNNNGVASPLLCVLKKKKRNYKYFHRFYQVFSRKKKAIFQQTFIRGKAQIIWTIPVKHFHRGKTLSNFEFGFIASKCRRRRTRQFFRYLLLILIDFKPLCQVFRRVSFPCSWRRRSRGSYVFEISERR